MRYVYGCTVDPTHQRQEVSHGMTEEVHLVCLVCGADAHRIPQPFQWGRRPFDTLLAGLEEKYRADTYRRSLSK